MHNFTKANLKETFVTNIRLSLYIKNEVCSHFTKLMYSIVHLLNVLMQANSVNQQDS